MIGNNVHFNLAIFLEAVSGAKEVQGSFKDGIGFYDFWRISKAIFDVGSQGFQLSFLSCRSSEVHVNKSMSTCRFSGLLLDSWLVLSLKRGYFEL